VQKHKDTRNKWHDELVLQFNTINYRKTLFEHVCTGDTIFSIINLLSLKIFATISTKYFLERFPTLGTKNSIYDWV